MEPKGDLQHLEFLIPSRGLIGLRNHILTATSGTAIMTHRFTAFKKHIGDIETRTKGSLTSSEQGPATAFALNRLQDRGRFFVSSSDIIYKGQVIGEHMLKNGKGSIINISSASAGPPLSKAFTYSIAKAGIKNLTQNLAREWGTKGVRVNAIRPGFFPTDWNLKNFIDDKRKKEILGHTPMNRFGNPDELTGAILWLSSDAASFVTGSEVSVDGGFSCMTI